MLKQPGYFDLGASLYIPCTHHALPEILQKGVPSVRSLVVCLEDSIKEHELLSALDNLKRSLEVLEPSATIKRFIRPRHPLLLEELLHYTHIKKIDGFVLPKFDLDNSKQYKKIFQRSEGHCFSVMPILETHQVFDPQAMRRLSKQLKNWEKRIVCLRIGGNDLMNLLGIKRMQEMTTYDTPLRTVIDQLVIQFRPNGFELSAPVFDMLDDLETLKKEVEMDLMYGFYAKTAIHPSQIEVIESVYSKFSQNNIVQAKQVLKQDSAAVFRLNGQMMETNCHKAWATRTLELAKSYH